MRYPASSSSVRTEIGRRRHSSGGHARTRRYHARTDTSRAGYPRAFIQTGRLDRLVGAVCVPTRNPASVGFLRFTDGFVSASCLSLYALDCRLRPQTPPVQLFDSPGGRSSCRWRIPAKSCRSPLRSLNLPIHPDLPGNFAPRRRDSPTASDSCRRRPHCLCSRRLQWLGGGNK